MKPTAQKLYSVRCKRSCDSTPFPMVVGSDHDTYEEVVGHVLEYLEITEEMDSVTLKEDPESQTRLLFHAMSAEEALQAYETKKDVPYNCLLLHIAPCDSNPGGSLFSQLIDNAMDHFQTKTQPSRNSL